MKPLHVPKAGFTLIEIMVVVAVIGLFATLALPSFAKARKNVQKKVCIQNLKAIDVAKQEWAFDKKKPNSTVPKQSDLTPYLKGWKMPACPAGGVYQIKGLDKNPSCSLGRSGHLLK